MEFQTIIVLAVVTVLVGFGLKFTQKQGEPQSEFPGFIVREGDFEKRDGTVYRVNSDGLRIDLRKWKFDDRTGEFLRITKRVDGHIVFSTVNYSERFLIYAKRPSWGPHAVGIVTAIFGVMMIPVAEAIIEKYEAGSTLETVFLVILLAPIALMFGLGVSRFIVGTKANIVGPEPLTRITEDFGAAQPETPAHHPAQVDLAYKPNA